MRIEVWNHEKKPDNVLRLRLREYSGAVQMDAVDKHGVEYNSGSVLWIDAKGIHIAPYSADVPLPLDSKGRVRVIGYTPDDELPAQRGAAELERLIEAARGIRQGVNVSRVIDEKAKFDKALAAYETAVK